MFKKGCVAYLARFMLEYSMNEYTRHTMHAIAMTPLATLSRPAKKCTCFFNRFR